MKIIVYCQHVLGVGHFFRTLEIIKALEGHDIVLVTGGDTLPGDLPGHVRQVNLPGLMMDEGFRGLYSVDPERTVKEVKQERRQMLEGLFLKERPDLFLVELYPFGRKAFRFELDPVLSMIRQRKVLSCRIVCSLRDILVEKEDALTYEKRVVNTLNLYFDAVLIHSDPRLITLDSSFSKIGEIKVPIFYTGFVTPLPDGAAMVGVKTRLGILQDESLVVVSAGGGTVGAPLLRASVLAHSLLLSRDRVRMIVLTGPYMDQESVNSIQSLAGRGVLVKTFCKDFISLVSVADLSISMAGYNTCMNLVAAGVPSLVWPFSQNREQLTRAEALAGFADLGVLDDQDLVPKTLALIIQERLADRSKKITSKLDLGGARAVARWVEELGKK